MSVTNPTGGNYYRMGFRGPKRVCDVCGLTFYQEEQLRKQDGYWKCITGPHCFDEKDENDQD
jgi:hypothetical protein